MDIESPLKPSTHALTLWLIAFHVTFIMVLFPCHVIQEELQPVLKESRPYLSHVVRENPEKQIPYQIKSTKNERLYNPIIIDAADRYSIDPALIKAIIMAESSYNPAAISKKGAIGLMQLMPATADELGVEDSFNPVHNINGGVRYLKELLNQFEGDQQLAVAAYNAGSKKVKRYQGIPPYRATRYYVQKVFEYYRYYKRQNLQQSDKI